MDHSTSIVILYEPATRLGAFTLVFAAMALWEIVAPRRRLTVPKARRWAANIGIIVLNSVLVRLIFPTAAVGTAMLAAENGWGLFNQLQVPAWAAILFSLVALDFVIYLQHVMFHAVPALWRLHRVHHADLDFDITTGVRFHPVEIALSMLIKFAAIILTGAPVAAVLLFEILLNALAMFNHGNVRIPTRADRALRYLIVTPDMHRIHHSIERHETDSNFGFNLSLWDRLLGTYRANPAAGHENMVVGIPEFRDPAQCTTFTGMLALPLRSTGEIPRAGRTSDNDKHGAALS